MRRQMTVVVMLSLLIMNVGVLVFNVQPVRAAGTIYIMADGSINPPTAPISTSDNIIYLLTNDTDSSIVVQRSNILLHGNGFTVQGAGSGTGIDLSTVSNVTVEETNIVNFQHGIILGSPSNSILKNHLISNQIGVFLAASSNNTICYNEVINSTYAGILLNCSSYNMISKNNITTNYDGILLDFSNDNTIVHNNFVESTSKQANIVTSSSGIYDEGYPWCGNYWSDYNGTDIESGPFQNETESDGVGDTVYTIDTNNTDNYPLMNPWTSDFTVQNHMVVAYSYSPLTLDPACAYTTSSLEAIMNVYESLTFFDEEKMNQFVPRLATSWMISPDGLTYTFNIRQGVRFHNNENLTAEDVEYSLERMIVIERLEGPVWMFYDAFFNLTGSQDYPGHFIITGQQIDDAVTRNETAVTLHLAKPYPPFMQILSQPWGSVLCKKWCTQIGDWPGTYDNWTLYNRPTRTAIENQTTGPPGPRTDAMCGTGPFMLDYYVTNGEWQLLRFDNYWAGWPAPGSSGSLRRVTVKRVNDWSIRKEAFLDGQLDYTNVPSTGIDEILEQPGIRSIYPLESLTCEAVFFTFNISMSSPFMGVPGGLPEGTLNESGIPPDFFTDINVRKGFAYAFNYSELIAEALRGEAYQPATPIIPGLPFYNPAQEKYSADLERANQSFSQAWGGQLWSSGFSFTVCYNEGNTYRKKTCEIVKASVESLNPRFHVYLQPVPWNNYTRITADHEAPIFSLGWLADYADPHNFAYGFMYSQGPFPLRQAYSNSTIDMLVIQGIGTPNETERATIYRELQKVYHEDCPSFPTFQPFGRRFERTWVQGWYYNPLLAGNYFYTQWKGSVSSSTRYSWPMFHHDSTHTGYCESPAPGTNQTRWNYTTGDAVDSSPAVTDGRVYIGSADGKAYCLDAFNGTQIWNSTIGGTDSSPAIADGKVYIGSYDNNVFCLDALTGVLIWNHTTIGSVYSSPTVVEGRVYFGSFGGEVYCLDAITGILIWNRTIGSGVDSSPAVVGGKVYFGSNDGIVHCLDSANGEPVWSCIAGLSIFSSPAVVDNRLYVGADNGTFYCLDAISGAVIWKQYVGGAVLSSPAVANGRVYVGSENGQIVCFYTLTGEWAWNQTIGATDSSPAVADNKVYIGSSDNKTYCYDAITGLPVWTYTTGGPIWSSPAVADGMVFIGSENGSVHAFGNVIRVPQDYATIQEAIDAATPGATIWVEPGIYNESLVINKTISIIGKRGSSPTFKGGGGGIAITLLPGGSGSIIAGVIITNWDQGIFVYEASECKIYDNIMSLMSKNGIVLEGANASDNQVCYNIFEQNTIAINLTSSAFNNTVSNNIVSMGHTGIRIESDGNTVCANIIAENELGMEIASSNNKIYHNNFVSNIMQLSITTGTTNAWDDGYPSGGNFWLNKVGEDNLQGPQQNIQGSDGIFDTPYNIASNNVDNYPLIRPFSVHNVGIMSFVKSKSIVGESFTFRINLKIQNIGMYNETLTLTAYANTTLIYTQTIDLTRRNSVIFTIVWNTAGFAKGNYTIGVVVGALPDETETADNAFSFNATVVIPGDITADSVVDILDAIVLANSFDTSPGDLYWNPDADINDEDTVDILDAIVLANHFGEQLQ